MFDRGPLSRTLTPAVLQPDYCKLLAPKKFQIFHIRNCFTYLHYSFALTESEENQAKLLVLRDKDGLPCLIKALKRQSLDCIEPLLQRFNNLLPVFDKNGINKLDALMSNNLKNLFHIGAEIATDRDIIDAIEMCPLKEKIADMTDPCGATPLIVACQRQNHQMAVLLVSYKAKIDHVDNQGYSPIYLAAANGCADLLKMFLVHGTW